MSIKNRIENIKEYFKEMQIVTVDGEQIIYVKVLFPNGWIIDENINTKYNVTYDEGNYPGEFYFATEIENGEDNIFNAIESNIEKMKEALERAQLLKVKMLELKDIFQDEENTLNELRSLKFTWDKTEDKLIKNIMSENGMIVVPNDNISISVSSNVQDATTSAEVERQYTSENTKSNKKNKK